MRKNFKNVLARLQMLIYGTYFKKFKNIKISIDIFRQNGIIVLLHKMEHRDWNNSICYLCNQLEIAYFGEAVSIEQSFFERNKYYEKTFAEKIIKENSTNELSKGLWRMLGWIPLLWLLLFKYQSSWRYILLLRKA